MLGLKLNHVSKRGPRQQQGKHLRNVEQTYGLSLTVIDTVYDVKYKHIFTRFFVCIMIFFIFIWLFTLQNAMKDMAQLIISGFVHTYSRVTLYKT